MEFPKQLNDMKPQERWDWYEHQKQILRDAAKNGDKVELTAELSECFMFMSDLAELGHCQMIVMHNNAVVVAASALVEKDSEMCREWLLNLVEQADDVTWQMYDCAEDYYQRHKLPWINSIEDFNAAVEKQNTIFDEDNAKFEVWYQENIVPILK
ncbi:hypothetical protein [Acinetobacter soli]|uniref:hypothetical protein n=1 Tax=Acinetobacter soli TaxID=487316 RepID=UPI0026E0AF4A|nr:hypothetical protein [Acinetobacter soli]